MQSETDLEEDCYSELVGVADHALELYRKQEISEIRILYTHFVNSVTFEPKLITLLPVERRNERKATNCRNHLEPAGDRILDTWYRCTCVPCCTAISWKRKRVNRQADVWQWKVQRIMQRS